MSVRSGYLYLKHREKMNTKVAALLVLALVVAAIHLPSCESFGMSADKKRNEIQVGNFVFSVCKNHF